MKESSATKFYHFKVLINEHLINKRKIRGTTDLVKMASNCDLQPGVDYAQFHQLYDVAEATLNEFVGHQDIPNYVRNAMVFLQSYAELLPTFTERSSDKSLYQQFSTPLDIAWVLIQLANIKSNDWVLEPSAGTGSISSLLKRSLANRIIVNEIHPFRHWLLTEQAYHNIFREDAAQIHNLPKLRQLVPDKIVMNPPFSRSIQTKAKVDVLAGAKHLLSSYKILKEGGRLVLLINASFNKGSKGYSFFQQNAPEHHLVMNATIDPETFKKKGTHFETRIMVIDKNPEGKVKIPHTQINQDNISEILELNLYNHG
ncbi:MAG: hypothetical protein RLO12_03595 [Fulvivirga sp.]